MSDPVENTEVHPLFNAIILGRVFSFLQIPSLKHSRLTCRTWRQTATPFLQKTSKVVLVRGGKADHDHFSFRNFLELISSGYSPEENSLPFENFYLDHWAINEKREKSLKQFWDVCGRYMKTLHLSNVIFYEVDTIRNLLYYWSPNLESLTLEDCLFYTITNENEFGNVEDALSEDFDEPNISYDYYDHVTVEQLKDIARNQEISSVNANLVELTYDQLENEEFPLSWEEVFHAFPNIQKLNISCSTSADQISKILDTIHTVREDSSTLGSITHLKLYRNEKTESTINVADAHLYKISDIICLPLTSLSFIITSSIQLESIVNLVRQYSPVLKNLCIHSETEGSSSLELFKFQKFPCLSKLCVSKDVLGGTFNFIETMPNLQQMHLWTTEEEFNWEAGIDEEILKSGALKSFSGEDLFEMSFGYTIASEKATNMLCHWFKNVRVLMMALTDEIIRVVYTEMIQVEEITVFDRHLSDAGITGNPRSLSNDSPWKVGSQREFPYIGDLKKLWKFTLTFRRYENITDSSVYQGLIDVPSLSSLLLTRTKIGEKALRELSLKPTLITMVTPTVCKGVELEYSE